MSAPSFEPPKWGFFVLCYLLLVLALPITATNWKQPLFNLYLSECSCFHCNVAVNPKRGIGKTDDAGGCGCLTVAEQTKQGNGLTYLSS